MGHVMFLAKLLSHQQKALSVNANLFATIIGLLTMLGKFFVVL